MSHRPVAVFDLDGTITYKDTYVEFLIFCLRKRPQRILRGGALLVYLCAYKCRLRSNHWLKARYLGAVAGGLGGVQLDKLCAEFSELTLKNNIKPEALEEIHRLREQGYLLVLATASFEFYVRLIFEALEMDELLCSKAEYDCSGRLTGELDGSNCIGEEKASRVLKLLGQFDSPTLERAYSDDKVDLPLFRLCAHALVVDPKAATEKVATANGFQVLRWK